MDEGQPRDDLLVDTGPPADTDAEFTRFMAGATPDLARTAWLLCGDATLADELVQEALTRTYLSWPRARTGDPVAHARRTLANLRIETWRGRRRIPAGDGERDQLARALALLSTRQRRVVVLRHFAGLSERQVADDLRLSTTTVRSAADHAVSLLRAALEPTSPSPERSR